MQLTQTWSDITVVIFSAARIVRGCFLSISAIISVSKNELGGCFICCILACLCRYLINPL